MKGEQALEPVQRDVLRDTNVMGIMLTRIVFSP